MSRQTIYYLEKGTYNPSLTISFKISEVLKKTLEEIFYQEPVVKELMGSKTLDELDYISEKSGVTTERLIKLKNLNDEQLLETFNKDELKNIAEALGVNFDDLFVDE